MGFVDFIVSLLRDPRAFIAAQIAAGPVAAYGFVFAIIFIETGVVFFPFLPGDSLLFASGFFAQGGGFHILMLLFVAWAAAILGDQCNFFIGHFLGRKIIDSGKVKAMTPERIAKSEAFLDRWGSLAIFLGRFFPFIRTFVPFLAGMGGMKWHNFVLFNILGGSMSPHPAIIIRNCANTGAVRGSGESATIAGWLGDNSGSMVTNCYNTGRLIGIDGSGRNMVRHGGASAIGNLYEFYNSSAYMQGKGKEWATAAPISSGELCHSLSLGPDGGAWGQDIGVDEAPLPFGTSPEVYLCGKASCSGEPIEGEAFFSNRDEGIVLLGHQFEKGHCTVCGALEPGYPFPPRKVFLMAGQSNADGRAAVSSMPQYIRDYASSGSRFCYWSYANGSQTAWQMFGGKLTPYMPYTDNNTTSRCGFDGIVYHLIEEALHERFFVIKESLGGTAIDTRCSTNSSLWWYAAPEWLATAAPRGGHSLALEFTENIGLCIDNVLSQLEEGYQIQCIMWHQGESDRTQAASYHDNLQQLVAYLRAFLVEKTGEERYATLPFIAGTVNRSSTQYNAEVEQAVLRLAEEDENFHAVDMSDCKLGSDNLHFDATGCIDAAGRMFAKLEELGLLDEEDATGTLLPLKGDGRAGREGCFDLQGRQWTATGGGQPRSPGIYIKDGRKVHVGSR